MKFRVITRERAAANAKRTLSQSYMGRNAKHIADELPDDPTPDQVDATVERLEGVEHYTWLRCGACGALAERGVSFDGRFGQSFRVCAACLKAACARFDLVTARGEA